MLYPNLLGPKLILSTINTLPYENNSIAIYNVLLGKLIVPTLVQKTPDSVMIEIVPVYESNCDILLVHNICIMSCIFFIKLLIILKVHALIY